MTTLYLLLLLLASVFFALSAFGLVIRRKVNLLSLGLFCWVLVSLIHMLKSM